MFEDDDLEFPGDELDDDGTHGDEFDDDGTHGDEFVVRPDDDSTLNRAPGPTAPSAPSAPSAPHVSTGAQGPLRPVPTAKPTVENNKRGGKAQSQEYFANGRNASGIVKPGRRYTRRTRRSRRVSSEPPNFSASLRGARRTRRRRITAAGSDLWSERNRAHHKVQKEEKLALHWNDVWVGGDVVEYYQFCDTVRSSPSQLAHFPARPLPSSPTSQLAHFPARPLPSSPTSQLAHLSARPLPSSPTCQLAHLSARPLPSSPTCQLVHLPARPLPNPDLTFLPFAGRDF
jgi:hypothetical protein